MDAWEHLRNSPPSPVLEIEERMLAEKGVRVFVKRDDLLALPVEPGDHAFCGNKWRKMKYNLLAAREQGFRALCTFGGAFSNHIAACAAAGPLFGFQTIGVIRGEECLPLNPTLAFARRCGMVLHFMDRHLFREKTALDIVEWTQSDPDATYVIPEGGSNTLALQGCRELALELMAQCAPDVCCAPCGTGATLAGLIQGFQSEVQVLGISVLKGAFMKKSVAAFLPDGGEGDSSLRWDLATDYHFGGYARHTPELMQFIQAFEARHGIPLDQVYTGKLFFGVWDLIRRNHFPRGTRLCVVHTGGLQGRVRV
jgi:1-aminocyclopropane-1-carboxylate deaminase